MAKKCPECNKGWLKPVGICGFDDLIEAECNNCHEVFELEQDGLGEGGLEFIDAFITENDLD